MDIDSFLQPSSHKKMYDQLFSLCQTKLEASHLLSRSGGTGNGRAHPLPR